MTLVRRLDHIAIAVPSTQDAITALLVPLGLEVEHTEVIEELGVRLTYADVGNARLQLVEPLANANPELARFVAATGGGLHHVCFGTDHVAAAAQRLRSVPGAVRLGRGRGRPSAFAPGTRAGVRIEFTAFDAEADGAGRGNATGRTSGEI